MRIAYLVPAALILVGVAACAPSNAPTMSSSPGAASQMPQSPNSLPTGDTVNAPVTTGAGTVARTPARR